MIKVAGYCRVSTDKDDQTNSFEAQKRYFREYISRHDGWELSEIYADEGISGTGTKKRAQFNRMIRDAYDGNFRLIITKEVSRFSRNILDTIAYTRELKAIGVSVLFLTDNINTEDRDAELRLSIMASLAQEESRRTSDRVVWGQTRQMERGVVFGHSLLGYEVKNGKITPEPEGAEIVRMIFHKYAVEQQSAAGIAADLMRSGCSTGSGSLQWSAGSVIRILRNEKYVGDLIQKKTYTPDYLTHEKRQNHGEVPMIRIEDHHEPIVSRAVWTMAQTRLKQNNRHRQGSNVRSGQYVFSGKIRCGVCGENFVVRYKYRKDGTRIRRWSCASAPSCGVGRIVRDDDAAQLLKTALRALQIDIQTVSTEVTALALNAIGTDGTERGTTAERICCELDRVQRKKEAVLDSYFSGDISKSDMQTMCERYTDRTETLRQQLERTQLQTAHPKNDNIPKAIQSILTGEEASEAFDRMLIHSLTVFPDRHMELRLQCLPHVFRFT